MDEPLRAECSRTARVAGPWLRRRWGSIRRWIENTSTLPRRIKIPSEALFTSGNGQRSLALHHSRRPRPQAARPPWVAAGGGTQAVDWLSPPRFDRWSASSAASNSASRVLPASGKVAAPTAQLTRRPGLPGASVARWSRAPGGGRGNQLASAWADCGRRGERAGPVTPASSRPGGSPVPGISRRRRARLLFGGGWRPLARWQKKAAETSSAAAALLRSCPEGDAQRRPDQQAGNEIAFHRCAAMRQISSNP